MARIRSIKPEYPKDELLGTVSRDARLLYPLLWLIADDEGRFRCASPIVKAECFPYDEDLKISDVRRILEELIRVGRIVEYEAEGQKYGWMPKFLKHQYIDHPSKFRFPSPPLAVVAQHVGGSRASVESVAREPGRKAGGIGYGNGQRKNQRRKTDAALAAAQGAAAPREAEQAPLRVGSPLCRGTACSDPLCCSTGAENARRRAAQA